VEWLRSNTDKLVELTIVSDDYLSANDRKRLYDCHGNIISIIPETKKQDSFQFEKPGIDLNKNIRELFVDYFVSKHGQNPDKNLLDLFNEILSEEDEDS
jgi:DNA repair protein SbcD/Mre11